MSERRWGSKGFTPGAWGVRGGWQNLPLKNNFVCIFKKRLIRKNILKIIGKLI
jgi:hypothetical protein